MTTPPAGNMVKLLPSSRKDWNILERTIDLLFFSDKLSDSLSAYRKLYSCQSTLLRILEELRFSLDSKQLATIDGLDLSKAFDSLPHGLLMASK